MSESTDEVPPATPSEATEVPPVTPSESSEVPPSLSRAASAEEEEDDDQFGDEDSFLETLPQRDIPLQPPKPRYSSIEAGGKLNIEQLERIAKILKDPSSQVVGDHRQLLRKYSDTVIGQEVVEWLVKNVKDHVTGTVLTRSAAVSIGQQLMDSNLLHHVQHEHPFRDSGLLYRFQSANFGSYAKSGWLTKRGEKVKNWKQRFFVMDRRSLLYFKTNDPEKMGRPLKAIILKGALVYPIPKDTYGREFCFGISTRGRDLILQAASEAQWVDWMGAVIQYCKEGDMRGAKKSVIDFSQGTPAAFAAAAAAAAANPAQGMSGMSEEMAMLDIEDPDRDAVMSPSAAAPDARVVASLFDFTNVLGRGAFGKVFRVVRKSDGRVFALKVMHKERVIEANQSVHVMEERDVMRQLDHPFIVNLHASFSSERKLYMAIDFAQGGELTALMSNGCPSLEISRFVAAELFLAIEFMHRLNIIHRDLKPENVFFDNQGHVKLGDFGLSKKCEPSSRLNSFVGTPEFLAPEILEKKGYNREVDWWAYGILIYELLYGETPFSAQRPDAVYMRIKHEDVYYSPKLSPESVTFLKGLLARDPKARIKPDEMRAHAFFKGINFTKLVAKEIKSPLLKLWKGPLQPSDLRHFDPLFVFGERAVDSIALPVPSNVSSDDNRMLTTFDWTGPGWMASS